MGDHSLQTSRCMADVEPSEQDVQIPYYRLPIYIARMIRKSGNTMQSVLETNIRVFEILMLPKVPTRRRTDCGVESLRKPDVTAYLIM